MMQHKIIGVPEVNNTNNLFTRDTLGKKKTYIGNKFTE